MTLMGNFQGSLQFYYLYAPQTSQKISLESAISHFSLPFFTPRNRPNLAKVYG